MHTLYLYLAQAVATAPAPEPGSIDPQQLLTLVLTTGISATVIASLITGLIQFIINRRNSRIVENKNTTDAEGDLVTRYREAAAEERAQKESAVETIRALLAISEDQIDSLKSTVDSLTQTIAVMRDAAGAQKSLIDQIIADRDRIKASYENAQLKVDQQREELIRTQREILELSYPHNHPAENLPNSGSAE